MADDKYLNLEGLTHFKEKLDDTFAEKGDLDSKQDLITDTNKLDYALIDNTPSVPTKMSELINDKNYISLSSEGTEDVQVYTKNEVDQLLENVDPTESDPIFTASVAAGITSDDITNWNGKTTVTESTVSGWGFTKNTGTYSKPSTGIPKTDLASAVQTSLGKADSALQSYTETDPVFSASAAAGIKSTDITNWNSKTSNVGTITGITMNGVSKGTSGVVDLGDVVTDIESLDVEEVALDNNTLQIINGKLTVVLPIFDGEEVQ